MAERFECAAGLVAIMSLAPGTDNKNPKWRSFIMSKNLLQLIAGLSLAASACSAQTLPAKWEDLTSADFVKAIEKADGVCILPMGSIEKFGPSAPVGTNLYLVRIISLEAVKQEYAVIFPEYFVAQTTDTSTLPGAIHYSMSMQLQFLQETTQEMARNGCKKIILGNGHTGNNSLISLFMQNITALPHDYAVYTIYVSGFPIVGPQLSQLPPAAQPSKLGADGHGGEERVAALMAYYPDLVHTDRAHDEPTSIGHGLERAADLGGGTNVTLTGSMKGPLPTGYSGDASGATAARGHALVDFAVDKLVIFVRAVKADDETIKNQKLFYEHVEHPENTPGAK
jgi:creatinine amidohydrolase